MPDAWSELTIDGGDRRLDHELLGLTREGPGQAGFDLTAALARLDGRLFGGTAIAVAVALAEVETARPALWTTVQFIAGDTEVGDRFACTTEVLAEGRSAAQVRVTAKVGGREIFCALGATAHRKPGRIEVDFETFPSVPSPEESAPFLPPMPDGLRAGAAKTLRNLELRNAPPLPGSSTAPRSHLTLWARVPGRPATPAMIAYLADLVPLSIARAADRAGGGSSIDNTMRFAGVATADEWILLELDPHLASGGYGHGSVLVWSPDGHLLATGGQTASLLLFD
jgi:acyl-CoA thioesterase